MKISTLLRETSEVSLDIEPREKNNSLMGIEAHQIVGGNRSIWDSEFLIYSTPIETRYSNGNIGAETTTDTHEPEE
jgi:hypothetical protein